MEYTAANKLKWKNNVGVKINIQIHLNSFHHV